MKIQSVDNSSFYLQTEAKTKVFSDNQESNLPDMKLQLPNHAQGETKKAPDPQKLDEAVDKANRTLETYGTELRFSIHEASGEVMVKVINTKDDSVVREIPPERVLDFVANIKKMLGIIIDKLI